MHFFNHSTVLLLTLLAFWFPGWNQPPKPAEDPKPQLIHLLEAEQHRCQEAESQAALQSKSRDRWQQVAAFLCIGSALVLFVGIILGSKARHESQSTAAR